MNTALMKQVKAAIRQPYAWPGGYPISLVTDDGGLLCPTCARKEFRQVCHDTVVKGWNYTGWKIARVGIMWEGPAMCDNCNADLSAYGEGEE